MVEVAAPKTKLPEEGTPRVKSTKRISRYGTPYYYTPYSLMTEEQKEASRKRGRDRARIQRLAAKAAEGVEGKTSTEAKLSKEGAPRIKSLEDVAAAEMRTKEAQKKYHASDKYKAVHKRYESSDKGKAKNKRYRQSLRGQMGGALYRCDRWLQGVETFLAAHPNFMKLPLSDDAEDLKLMIITHKAVRADILAGREVIRNGTKELDIVS